MAQQTNVRPGRRKRDAKRDEERKEDTRPSEPEVKATLVVESVVMTEALFLRQTLATASVEDGTSVEVAFNVGNGDLLISRHPKKGSRKPWTTFVLTAEKLVLAVLQYEAAQKATAAALKELADGEVKP